MPTTRHKPAISALTGLRDATMAWAFAVNDVNPNPKFAQVVERELQVLEKYLDLLERGDLSQREVFEFGVMVGTFAHMTSCRMMPDGTLDHRLIEPNNTVAHAVAVMQAGVLKLYPVAV